MTQIQIINLKRSLTGYTEVTYKMSFTLPAIFGTGANPIEGLSKIASSYSNGFGIEVIPVTGTVITLIETISPDSTFTLAQAKTFLQNRYTVVRGQLDSLSLSVLDNMSGLEFDGSVWASTATITDNPLSGDQSNLSVTATGAAGAAVTLTLPAVVGKFHNIIHLTVNSYSTVARVGGVTPVIVTTTNITGSPAFTFASAAAVGTTDVKVLEPTQPIKSAVANTPTTIVCPTTPSVIWRVIIFYSLSA